MRDIAKKGLKGRKKDTFLLKLVITLSFIFIVASTIFQASTEKTKLEQRLDLYGEWHAAYLGSDEETLYNLINEPEVDKVGVSLIIGKSDNCGVIGTFNQDLIDMSRFSLYKGRYPEAANEIMLEMNQMSNMNLDLEVGQEIDVVITIPRVEADPKEYIMNKNKEFYKYVEPYLSEYKAIEEEAKKKIDQLVIEYEKEDDEEAKRQIQNEIDRLRSEVSYYYWALLPKPTSHEHNETPFDQVGDVSVVVHSNYFYYHMPWEEFTPEVIKKDGLLLNQKVILKKKFVVTGILQTYTDKWDLGGHMAPNAFITEEGGKTLTDALRYNEIGDFSDYGIFYNVFLYSDSYKEELYNRLSSKYSKEEDIKEEPRIIGDVFYWMNMFGKSEEEIDEILKESENWAPVEIKDDYRDDSLEGAGDLVKKIEVNTDRFRRNVFSYPEITASTEHILTLAIIAVIFITTALAIFQIFLTQMKRRARKIVLLKSIGATNGQVVKMLFYEGVYLLRTGLIIGVPIGFGVAWAVIYGMNAIKGRELQFHIMPDLLILGVIAGCLALFIGMAVPMIYAIRIPLVGTMSKPPKHKKIKHKENGDLNIRRQTFGYINWRYFKLNKGKTFISFGISFITIAIMLIALLLCYFSFDNYRNTVLANNRPDYAMELYYGEAVRTLNSDREEIMQIEGIKEAEVYKAGMQTFLWYDGIENNELLKAFEKLLPNDLLPFHFSKYNTKLEDQPEWIKNAFYTKIYGIDTESELFKRYSAAITEGTIDKKKFDEGEEVILLVPMYLTGNTDIEGKSFDTKEVVNATNESNRMAWLFDRSGAYKLSYSIRYKDYYSKQNDIKPGDTIYLSADAEKIIGESYVVDHYTKKVTVGGLIYYFPKEGMWPFSNNLAPYIVIGSTKCMESIYPNSRLGLYGVDLNQMKTMVDILYPTKYGRTLWYINTDSRDLDPVFDSKLLAFANNKGYTLYNYKDSSSQLYYEAFNNAVIIGLLGFTAVFIAFIILYNTTVSKMEQDRNRIGILQSLGVTKEQFSRHYINVGVISGFISILIINILLIAVLLITSVSALEGLNMTFGDYVRDVFQYRLWLYPWPLHIALCAVFFILTVLINYLPSRNITSKYPVENIRSLSR